MIVFVFLPIACGGELSEEWQAAARRAARSDSLALAEAQFAAIAFDSIEWTSDWARAERGSVVWEYSCVACHGVEGRGNGPRAVEERLEPPSFRTDDWLYGGDVAAIRHRVYVGHGPDMPSWGLHELAPRDVDAVAFFIDRRLRGP